MINAAKMKSFHKTVQYMCSVCVLSELKETLFGEENGNDICKKAIRLKIQQLIDYDTFHDKGLRKQMPRNYTKIRCHMIFAIKHAG